MNMVRRIILAANMRAAVDQMAAIVDDTKVSIIHRKRAENIMNRAAKIVAEVEKEINGHQRV